MSIMNYTQQLESLLKEILNQFDNDPLGPGYTHETDEGEIVIVNSELFDLLDRATDLVYRTEDEGVGYATEEGE